MPNFTIRNGEPAQQLVLIKATGEVFMRSESGDLVQVSLLEREVKQLLACRQPIDAITVMAAIIARALRPN